MPVFRLIFLVSAISVFSYYSFLVFSQDETSFSTGVIPGVAISYDDRSEEELQSLKSSLENFQDLPKEFLSSLSKNDLGRENLFFPNDAKKTLK